MEQASNYLEGTFVAWELQWLWPSHDLSHGWPQFHRRSFAGFYSRKSRPMEKEAAAEYGKSRQHKPEYKGRIPFLLTRIADCKLQESSDQSCQRMQGR